MIKHKQADLVAGLFMLFNFKSLNFYFLRLANNYVAFKALLSKN